MAGWLSHPPRYVRYVRTYGCARARPAGWLSEDTDCKTTTSINIMSKYMFTSSRHASSECGNIKLTVAQQKAAPARAPSAYKDAQDDRPHRSRAPWRPQMCCTPPSAPACGCTGGKRLQPAAFGMYTGQMPLAACAQQKDSSHYGRIPA